MTHDELVTRARRWLRTTVRCGVVLTEHNACGEFPDAIGWKRSWSYVVECKVSRADFFADRKKPTRADYSERPALWCYYMTPPNLVQPSELLAGWGLLEVGERVGLVVKAQPHEDTYQDDRTVTQLRAEIQRFYYELRRYQAQGIRYKSIAELSLTRTIRALDPADDLTDEALLALGAIARERDTREATIAAMRRFLAGGVWQTVRGGARRT